MEWSWSLIPDRPQGTPPAWPHASSSSTATALAIDSGVPRPPGGIVGYLVGLRHFWLLIASVLDIHVLRIAQDHTNGHTVITVTRDGRFQPQFTFDRRMLMRMHWHDSLSLSEIANQIGCAYTTLVSAFRRLGLPKRSPRKQPKSLKARRVARTRSLLECIKCHASKPLDAFPKSSKELTGRRQPCRSCRNKTAFTRSREDRRKVEHGQELFRCSACNSFLPRSCYHSRGKDLYGLGDACKPCVVARTRRLASERISKTAQMILASAAQRRDGASETRDRSDLAILCMIGRRFQRYVYGEKRVLEKKLARPKHASSIALKHRISLVAFRKSMTLEQFMRTVYALPRQCAICGVGFALAETPSDWVIDHCHQTGRIRGLLCSRCNLGIGLFADSADVLERARTYLESNTFETRLKRLQ